MSTYTKQPSSADTRNAQGDTSFTDASTNEINLDRLTGSARRMFAKFDISDFTSGSASITSATVGLYYFSNAAGTPSGQVDCFKCTRAWVEGQSSWADYSTGNAWTTPGGDFVTSAPTGGNANIPAVNNFMTITITDIVKDAIDNVSSIVNVIFKYNNETSGTNDVPLFYSRREATNTTLRPILTINYTAPVTSGNFFLFE